MIKSSKETQQKQNSVWPWPSLVVLPLQTHHETKSDRARWFCDPATQPHRSKVSYWCLFLFHDWPSNQSSVEQKRRERKRRKERRWQEGGDREQRKKRRREKEQRTGDHERERKSRAENRKFRANKPGHTQNASETFQEQATSSCFARSRRLLLILVIRSLVSLNSCFSFFSRPMSASPLSPFSSLLLSSSVSHCSRLLTFLLILILFRSEIVRWRMSFFLLFSFSFVCSWMMTCCCRFLCSFLLFLLGSWWNFLPSLSILFLLCSLALCSSAQVSMFISSSGPNPIFAS